ncbi:THO complex subunit 3 [Pseudovirgaria hyperparasitica]|uniref:THO complex subunit 3 n=1 Tax=Pseudovirgaria hyperparasitica TaxID=470096 RepID=A0A6A6WJP0_9PEZI|nr:THO complex subunit 3 [Pseudovirgaria hyperparasitica]KAF2762057.1 THO complex subunit 3 [Pseudovirgaria hyperparasitica]
MAPARQKPLLKEKFVPIFSKLRTSTYVDTPLTRQPPPSHAIRTISWNALGTLIATGAADRTLRIWNPERTNVKYSTELRGHSGPVEKVEFNPTHESELASCSADGTVRLWDVRRKESIVEIKPNIGGIDLLAWKPDGGELIIGRQARVIPRSTLTPSTPLNCETPVSSLSFTHSTTNPSLLLCSTTGALTLHRYPDLSKLHTLRAHTSPLLSHSLNPPATLLATGGSDALITLWDTQDWVCVRKLDRSVGPVTSVSFSFDGSYVVGGSDEGTGLDIAHAETGEYVHSIDTNWPSPCVQWHPHRYVLAYTSDSGLRIIGASSTT